MEHVSIFGRSHQANGLSLWHRDAVGPIGLAVALALRTKYGQEVARSGEVGTYACQLIRGSTTTHSEHSHTVAVDINREQNPKNDQGILHTDLHRFGIDDGVAFIQAFLDAGFRWGGVWNDDVVLADVLAKNGKKIREGRVDPMHFELALGRDEVLAIDWDARIAQVEEEDDMQPDERRALMNLWNAVKGLGEGMGIDMPDFPLDDAGARGAFHLTGKLLGDHLAGLGLAAGAGEGGPEEAGGQPQAPEGGGAAPS